MKEFFKYINTPKKEVIHLTIFWRIVLFPIIFIWWFIFQLFAFSLFGGIFVVLMAFGSMLTAFGSSDWKEDFIEGVGFLFMPIIAPFIWLYKYFRLGEFNTLFEDSL